MKPFNLKEYLKNPSRKVVTRDGRNVKIHCTNYIGEQQIIAQVEGHDLSFSFYEEGIGKYWAGGDGLFLRADSFPEVTFENSPVEVELSITNLKK